MRSVFCIVTCFICIACNEFSLKKTDAENILTEQMKSIDWSTIDTYPSFAICDTINDVEKEKKCFEEILLRHLQHSINKYDIKPEGNDEDTLFLFIEVTKQGEFLLKNSDDLKEYKNLKNWWKEVQDSLPKAYAGQKRGVPVKVNFKIPIVLNQQ